MTHGWTVEKASKLTKERINCSGKGLGKLTHLLEWNKFILQSYKSYMWLTIYFYFSHWLKIALQGINFPTWTSSNLSLDSSGQWRSRTVLYLGPNVVSKASIMFGQNPNGFLAQAEHQKAEMSWKWGSAWRIFWPQNWAQAELRTLVQDKLHPIHQIGWRRYNANV